MTGRRREVPVFIRTTKQSLQKICNLQPNNDLIFLLASVWLWHFLLLLYKGDEVDYWWYDGEGYHNFSAAESIRNCEHELVASAVDGQ